MGAKELRDMSPQELEMKERELLESIFRFRLRRGTNQLDSPAALKQARRELARIKTIRTERERGIRAGRVAG